ncbi:MAG: zinc dependent phospholipase C family protein [Lachnospiraceae bacterium]
MYFFTHLQISKVLYKHFSGMAKLNKWAFAYGNIKPDLPSHPHQHHTLENYLTKVCSLSDELASGELSPEEFSLHLGEVCHYVSDFFCHYHVNETIHNKKLHHLLYELKQHYTLLRLPLKQRPQVFPSKKEPREDICSMISELRADYFSQPTSMLRDIDYAFSASVWICESIFYFLKDSPYFWEPSEYEFCSLHAMKGGYL